MGRWLDKIANDTSREPTELTQSNSVGFVGAHNSVIEEFVTDACSGINVTAATVIDNLLSVEDEGDILNGDLPKEQLRAFVQVWLSTGAKKVSGKI